MRILRGTLKGRNIICPRDTRPVSVLVRKACFDVLAGQIEQAMVLDLFAGSGSLGIEALSLGAKGVVFTDNRQECVVAINKNIFSFKLDQKAKAYLKDAYRAIHDFFLAKKSFDLIFLDPPYYLGMARISLQTLEECDILTTSGYIIVFCYEKDEFLRKSNKFQLIYEKKYGQTLLLIYRKIP
jgi:16S rRNA (guanine(966)-N(2))-methyltransferase RsmD